MGIFGYLLYSPVWQIVTSITLIVTLVFIIIYTQATKRLARETNVSVTIQEREMLFRQKPVISVFNFEPREFYFIPLFRNFSNVHAKLRVKAAIEFGDTLLKLPDDHLYNGKKIWLLQAGGQEAPPLIGNIDFPRILIFNEMIMGEGASKKGKLFDDAVNYTLDYYRRNTEYATITIECWTVNLNRSDSELYIDGNKNPVVEWYWKKKSQSWIPDVCPLVTINAKAAQDG